jgi:hypothetical protein
MARYIRGALVPGNIAYMPKMPMLESEVQAIAAYLTKINNDGLAATNLAISEELANREAEKVQLVKQPGLVISMKSSAEEIQ